MLGDIHGERSASLENALDSIIQRTLPSVDIAFDEYKFRVGVKLDKLFDEKLGDFNDGLVVELAYNPSCMYEKERQKDGEMSYIIVAEPFVKFGFAIWFIFA